MFTIGVNCNNVENRTTGTVSFFINMLRYNSRLLLVDKAHYLVYLYIN